MKLEVPFFNQTTKLNCGPSVLRMVLAYFDKDYGLPLLEERTRIEPGTGLATIQIVIAAASLGYSTEFYSKQIQFNKENLELDFYKKYENMIEKTNKWVKEAKGLGVHLEEKTLPLEEIVSKVTRDSLPIVLLDWNIVKGTKENGYQGHFVPIVGYDADNIYVHNHGLTNPVPFLKIDRKTFEEARTSKGTDEDIVFIHRKKSI